MNRQIALVNDQTDIWDFVTDEEPVEEFTGTLFDLDIPAAPEQLLIEVAA